MRPGQIVVIDQAGDQGEGRVVGSSHARCAKTQPREVRAPPTPPSHKELLVLVSYLSRASLCKDKEIEVHILPFLILLAHCTHSPVLFSLTMYFGELSMAGQSVFVLFFFLTVSWYSMIWLSRGNF